MKTIHYLILATFMSLSTFSSAQTSINPDLSLEAQSIVDEGAIHNIRYYYYPNLQAYFDTDTGTYLYIANNQWIEGNEIPKGLRGYSLMNKQRVAITDYSGDEPYDVFSKHKELYPANYNAKRQAPSKEQNSIALN